MGKQLVLQQRFEKNFEAHFKSYSYAYKNTASHEHFTEGMEFYFEKGTPEYKLLSDYAEFYFNKPAGMPKPTFLSPEYVSDIAVRQNAYLSESLAKSMFALSPKGVTRYPLEMKRLAALTDESFTAVVRQTMPSLMQNEARSVALVVKTSLEHAVYLHENASAARKGAQLATFEEFYKMKARSAGTFENISKYSRAKAHFEDILKDPKVNPTTKNTLRFVKGGILTTVLVLGVPAIVVAAEKIFESDPSRSQELQDLMQQEVYNNIDARVSSVQFALANPLHIDLLCAESKAEISQRKDLEENMPEFYRGLINQRVTYNSMLKEGTLASELLNANIEKAQKESLMQDIKQSISLPQDNTRFEGINTQIRQLEEQFAY